MNNYNNYNNYNNISDINNINNFNNFNNIYNIDYDDNDDNDNDNDKDDNEDEDILKNLFNEERFKTKENTQNINEDLDKINSFEVYKLPKRNKDENYKFTMSFLKNAQVYCVKDY